MQLQQSSKTHAACVLACLLFSMSVNALAAEGLRPAGSSQTGESLLGLIRQTKASKLSNDSLIAAGIAMGYVQAVRDHNVYNRWNMVALLTRQPNTDTESMKANVAKLFFCEPPRMSNEQILAVTEKFIEKNPERWTENAFNLVQDAFKGAYPCKVEDMFP